MKFLSQISYSVILNPIKAFVMTLVWKNHANSVRNHAISLNNHANFIINHANSPHNHANTIYSSQKKGRLHRAWLFLQLIPRHAHSAFTNMRANDRAEIAYIKFNIHEFGFKFSLPLLSFFLTICMNDDRFKRFAISRIFR